MKSLSCPLWVGAEMLTLSDKTIDAAASLRAFEASAKQAGAIVTFSGQVRPRASDANVKSLFLQAYPEMTEKGIREAIDDALARWPLEDLMVVHRIGEMVPGDTIVFVAVASRHRRAAFEAADFLMDYLKTKAVFWKREETDRGSAWIEPRPEDYQDAERWTAASDQV